MRTPVVGLAVAFMALLAACGTEDEVAPPTTDSRTPSSTDSPTSSPTELQYWVTPTATPPPTDWAALIEGVADHLTANADSADCLAGLFAAWNMPSDGTPSCVASDLDADGEDEYVVRLARPSGPTDGIGLRDWLIGQILVFDRVGQRYEPVFDLADIWASRVSKDPAVAGQEAPRLVHPIIYALKDLTGDGIPELVLTTNDCGAHTCFLMLYVYTNRDGAYVSLLTSPEGPTSGISVPVADNQLRLDDLDGDGVFELILRQGTVTSAGAGPQRVTVHTYRWNGEKFALTNSQYETPNYEGYSLYFLIRDADDAFARLGYGDAMALYREALEQPDLAAGYSTGSSAELRAYARYRIGLSYAAIGDVPSALAALNHSLAANPLALHSGLAQRFLDAYAPNSDIAAGCAASLAFVDENADAFRQIWEYGYANPNLGVERQPLCPF